MIVTVRDDQIAEADEPSNLWQKDSIEMYLAFKIGSPQFFQVVVGTGADPKFPKARTFINDRRKPAPPQKLEVETATTRTADGYVLEARLPWSNLAITPRMGVETAFELCLNDVDGNGKRLTLTWYPSTNTFSDPNSMYRLRLAATASPAMRMAGRASLDEGRPRVDVVASADLAGQKVTVKSKGEILATSKFESAASRAQASFLLPPGVDPEVSCANAGSVAIDCKRLDELFTCGTWMVEPVFKPSVFSGENFPPCDFAHPAEVEKLLGKCVLAPTFYDADYHEVKTANKPGRYGAIVQVKTANGQTFKRFVTLYRAPQKLNWKSAKIHMQSMEFPAELGLDPAVVNERANCVDDFFADQLRWGLSRRPEAAVLFAALSEMKPGGPPPPPGRNGPDALDQKWWCGLKKQTGNLRDDYHVYLPAGYKGDPQKKWPVILFLHGSGDIGYDINLVKPPRASLTSWTSRIPRSLSSHRNARPANGGQRPNSTTCLTASKQNIAWIPTASISAGRAWADTVRGRSQPLRYSASQLSCRFVAVPIQHTPNASKTFRSGFSTAQKTLMCPSKAARKWWTRSKKSGET